MHETPIPERYPAMARAEAVKYIMLQELSRQTTLQPEEVKRLFENLTDASDQEIQIKALDAKEVFDSLPELKRTALLLRIAGEPLLQNPFHPKP